MRWFFLAWAVVLLLVLMLTPAECCAKGLFSFFNPEVTTPVTAAPSNGSDIIGGMKATITLGSLGSVITSHLALFIFGILLYAALKRVDGPGYQARLLAWRERKSVERIEFRRFRNVNKENARAHRFWRKNPNLVSEQIGHAAGPHVTHVELDARYFDSFISVVDSLGRTVARMEAAAKEAQRKGERKR